jgi:hypothetical protein
MKDGVVKFSNKKVLLFTGKLASRRFVSVEDAPVKKAKAKAKPRVAKTKVKAKKK